MVSWRSITAKREDARSGFGLGAVDELSKRTHVAAAIRNRGNAFVVHLHEQLEWESCLVVLLDEEAFHWCVNDWRLL